MNWIVNRCWSSDVVRWVRKMRNYDVWDGGSLKLVGALWMVVRCWLVRKIRNYNVCGRSDVDVRNVDDLMVIGNFDLWSSVVNDVAFREVYHLNVIGNFGLRSSDVGVFNVTRNNDNDQLQVQRILGLLVNASVINIVACSWGFTAATVAVTIATMGAVACFEGLSWICGNNFYNFSFVVP